MTLQQSFVRRLTRSEAGFTIVEMMVATAIMMAVTGAVFSLLNPSQSSFDSQPEMADMQQRLRVGVDSMHKDLVMAGAGTYLGTGAGALYNFFAPIMPYRNGDNEPDAAKGIFYRPDTISMLYVPPTPAQTTIRDDMPAQSAELKVTQQPNCGVDKKNALCGFSEGMRVIIFDPSGSWDSMTITQVQDSALHLQHNQDKLSVSYQPGANITQVQMHTYYYNSDTLQLMHYDGYQTDLPVIDNVVKLAFEYFGEPEPPKLLPTAVLSSATGPWTTYGPKPPAAGKSVSAEYGDGANCTFQLDANKMPVPRLEPIDGGGVGQVQLDPAIFTDGPWCPDSSSPNRFDADLLRIRRVRANIRVQVGLPTLRGVDSLLWTKPGSAENAYKLIPDQEIRFDVAPRNMNLGR